MAGKVVVSTLNNDTGVLATQNGMTGIAKAWVNFAGASGTVAGSFNVSSVTRNGAGDYTINYTTAMPNANYAVSGTCRTQDSGSAGLMRVVTISSVPASAGAAVATTFVRINTTFANTGGALDDPLLVTLMVIGS